MADQRVLLSPEDAVRALVEMAATIKVQANGRMVKLAVRVDFVEPKVKPHGGAHARR